MKEFYSVSVRLAKEIKHDQTREFQDSFKQFHFAICSWSQPTLVRPEHTREDFAGLMLCSSPLGSSFVRDWSLLAMSAKRRLAFFLRKAASVALGWSLHGISCIYILISIRRFNLGSQFVSLWEFVVDP